MKSVYRFMGTTEGRKNGLLQMRRLIALLRKQGIPFIMKERPLPTLTFSGLEEMGINKFDWMGQALLRAEKPETYFEVTFDVIRNPTAIE